MEITHQRTLAIEVAWSHLDREIRKVSDTKDIEQLKKKLNKVWDDFPLQTIRVSVGSLPMRLEQCMRLRGRRTSY